MLYNILGLYIGWLRSGRNQYLEISLLESGVVNVPSLVGAYKAVRSAGNIPTNVEGGFAPQPALFREVCNQPTAPPLRAIMRSVVDATSR